MTQPVKGMVWRHAKRQNYRHEPVVLTVTSIQKATTPTGVDLVYSVDDVGRRVKTPLKAWERYCCEVVSVPEKTAKVTSTGPRLTARESALLFKRAFDAGMVAGNAAVPTPMVVVQRENPFDDNSRIVKQYEPVMDGVCGFAYCNITPGNSSFAKWLKKNTHAYKAYSGGIDYSVSMFGQSYERKRAFAAAFCDVLRKAGIKAHPHDRLD